MTIEELALAEGRAYLAVTEAAGEWRPASVTRPLLDQWNDARKALRNAVLDRLGDEGPAS